MAKKASGGGFFVVGLVVAHLRRPQHRWFDHGSLFSSCYAPGLRGIFTVRNALRGGHPGPVRLQPLSGSRRTSSMPGLSNSNTTPAPAAGLSARVAVTTFQMETTFQTEMWVDPVVLS